MKTAALFGAAALWCVPCLAKAQSADERLRAIYTEEWKWRLDQFPGLEGVTKPVPDRLPKVDPATQEMRLRYWQDVLHKLDDIPRAQLSPEEQINYDVYRPEIENFVADQKFRDYEMPANSDSAFWTDLGYTARRPFKTLTDYKNWIAQLRDIPRYFREQIANMRAGACPRLHAAAPHFAGPREIHRHHCGRQARRQSALHTVPRADGGSSAVRPGQAQIGSRTGDS